MKEEVKQLVSKYRTWKDLPALAPLTFEDLIRMDDDPVKYGEYAAYLLSRDQFLLVDDLSYEETTKWLEDIVSTYIKESESNATDR